MIDRRLFLTSGAALACGGVRVASGAASNGLHLLQDSLGKGARLGVFVVDTGSGRQIAFRADERFAMCSVFKFSLGAFVLRLADRGLLSLAEGLSFSARDLLVNSPVSEANVVRGRLTVGELAEAAVRESDNTAANLLLRRTGGPRALTGFIRASGDPVTRLDRYELALNSNVEGDPRDTTTPAAIATLARALVLGNVLDPGSRAKLIGWLERSVPKPDRLKAGFPQDWRVGHKPGTGRNGAVNDVAIAWPPRRSPIIATVFVSGGTAQDEARAAIHRKIARLVAERMG